MEAVDNELAEGDEEVSPDLFDLLYGEGGREWTLRNMADEPDEEVDAEDMEEFGRWD